jgi:hypothetical protein
MTVTRSDGSTRFAHERIDDEPPCARLAFCLTTDLTGNGWDDVIVGGMGAKYPGKGYVNEAIEADLPAFDRVRGLVGLDEMNIFWYENPGWQRHDVAFAPFLDVGGSLGDITGDGRQDIVAGRTIHHNEVYWFEQPDDPRSRWTRRTVTDRFEKYHDTAVADVDDDGTPEVVGLSQESETAFYYDIPADPTVEPWPDRCCHVVAENIGVEGLEVADVDGDGRTEIVAGPNVFHRPEDGSTPWHREPVVEGWDDTRVAVGDIDDDGDPELVFSEGDSPVYGSHPGRLAWFDPPDWTPTVLAEDLFCPHSLQIADFTGDGRPDVYTAEMGLGENDTPTQYLFCNRGDGTFEERILGSGIETHEARAVDLTGNGRPDIVGKSYYPDHHVDVWYNRH